MRRRIYRTRGPSSDTSLRAGFAIEDALKDLTLSREEDGDLIWYQKAAR
jgi:hypothetical protein